MIKTALSNHLLKAVGFAGLMIANVNLSADSVSLSAGRGMSDLLIQSGSIASTETLGIIYTADLGHDIELFDNSFDWHIEGAWYNLKGSHQANNDAMDIVYIKPKLRLVNEGWHFDAGLGLAQFTQENWEEINFSGDLMFAMSFGVGTHFGEADRWAVDLVYNHFSNGYTRSPNPGLDLLTLNLSFNF